MTVAGQTATRGCAPAPDSPPQPSALSPEPSPLSRSAGATRHQDASHHTTKQHTYRRTGFFWFFMHILLPGYYKHTIQKLIPLYKIIYYSWNR